ncbi:MAG: M48 family metallopeptidase [bacterium]
MYNQIDSNKRKTWLLIIIFTLLISGLGWFLSYSFNDAGIFVSAIIISIFMSLFGYFAGDKVALATAGAKQIKESDNQEVYHLVENLCITAGLQMPKIYLIDDQAINAFATGRDPKHASIAITTGAIARLENEELEGVIAHELSHVKNYDIRLMMIVIILVGVTTLIADFFWRSRFFGGSRSDNDNKGNLGAILAIVGIILIILSPIIAELIKLAISRKREYLADASGALLTRYPAGLANALEKIKNDSTQMSHANNATAHLYIANPFKKAGFMSNAFSTHPPIDDRIKKLREMA